MAVTNTEKENISKQNQEQQHFRQKIRPRYTAWPEEDKIIIRAVIPGVKKSDIQMKALKEKFMLRAPRKDILYQLDLDLNVEIEPENSKSTYNEGLLRVELKRHNPLDDAYEVPIN